MRGHHWVVVASFVATGCEKQEPRLEGPIDIRLGDCAAPTASWVSGPRPQRFDPATLDRVQTAVKDGKAGVASPGDARSRIDDTDIYGGLIGDEVGEMSGGFGFGRAGFGPGGGGTGWGTIGTGHYGMIGRGSGTGSGYGVGGGRGGMRGRTSAAPTVSIGQPNAQGDLDKAIIRRYIKRNIQKLQYCYEKQLLVKPKLQGTVATQFFIDPAGNVASANASGVDPEVASCVAGVIKRIEFPKPKGGGGVQVNYPFTFRQAGGAPPRPTTAPGGSDDTGGTGTAMALEEVKPPPQTARDQAIEQARTAGVLGAVKAGDPDYRPGETNPLRAIEHELVECFRSQSHRHGVAVIDLGGAELVAHGIENAAFKSCVASLAKQLARTDKAPLRCAVAFGQMAPDDAVGIDITTSTITMAGTKVADVAAVGAAESVKIPALYERTAARVKTVATSKTPVVLHGPLVVRPDQAVSMKVVNRVLGTLLAAGDDPVLAAKRGGTWTVLRPIELPVVPVPIGTGGSWATMKSQPRGTGTVMEDETVELSILLTGDKIWVGLSRVNEFQEVRDLEQLEATLLAHKKSAFFVDRRDLEIAGEDPVLYGKLVDVIDLATKLGFHDWTVTDPASLSARPSR